MSPSTPTLKRRAEAVIRSASRELVELSHAIHGAAEVGFEERESSRRVALILEAAGLDVVRGAWDLETAIECRVGTGPTVIGICAEYDALPVIGHACGHNIIAAASVGAVLGLRDVATAARISVRLIGTPGEEAGNASGKILELERGAFEGLDAAMMVHPGPDDILLPVMIAAALFDIEYTGKESHAAFYPERGVNAADAMIVAQTAIGLMRQQLPTSARVHGIVTHGGDAPNVIPARTTGRWMVRSTTSAELGPIKDRAVACFEAGEVATGAHLSISGGDRPYAEVKHNLPLAELYRQNAETLGRSSLDGDEAQRPTGSTDMGNVSLQVPTIHPFIGIGSAPAVNHQPEFAAHCVSTEADTAVLDAAIAMAWTAIDLGAQDDPRAFLRSHTP